MLPAYMIGLYLNVPVCTYSELVENQPLKRLGNRSLKKPLQLPLEANRICLVEDSYLTGETFKQLIEDLPNGIKEKTTTCAVYSSTSTPDIDLFLEVVPSPRIFEWNIFHHSLLAKCAFDMDGVLCEDPTNEENDDGIRYLEFLQNATPKFIPSVAIGTIVTSRLEKYRKQTEDWLQKHEIRYKELIMLDVQTAKERRTLRLHASFKADFYKKSKNVLFLESERGQAQAIHELTNKPVYCVDENVFLDGKGLIFSSIKTKQTFFSHHPKTKAFLKKCLFMKK